MSDTRTQELPKEVMLPKSQLLYLEMEEKVSSEGHAVAGSAAIERQLRSSQGGCRLQTATAGRCAASIAPRSVQIRACTGLTNSVFHSLALALLVQVSVTQGAAQRRGYNGNCNVHWRLTAKINEENLLPPLM